MGAAGGGGASKAKTSAAAVLTLAALAHYSCCCCCCRPSASSPCSSSSASSEPQLRQPRPRPVPLREDGVIGEPLRRGAGGAACRGGEGGGGGIGGGGGRESGKLSSLSSSRSFTVIFIFNKKSTEIIDKNTDLLHDRRLGEPAGKVLLQRLPLERLVRLEDVLPSRVARRARVGEDFGAEDEVAGEGGRGGGEGGDGGGGEGRDEFGGRSRGGLLIFFFSFFFSLVDNCEQKSGKEGSEKRRNLGK